MAYAEIERRAIPNDHGFSLYCWPKLEPSKGWHQDEKESYHDSINALAPDSFTFANAETVMYAKSIYKPKEPKVTSLQMLIENDRKEALSHTPDIKIQEAGTLTSLDGQAMKSLTFFPKGKGNWERVSYGEEGEFYLIFTVSSRTSEGYKAAEEAYETLIKNYQGTKSSH